MGTHIPKCNRGTKSTHGGPSVVVTSSLQQTQKWDSEIGHSETSVPTALFNMTGPFNAPFFIFSSVPPDALPLRISFISLNSSTDPFPTLWSLRFTSYQVQSPSLPVVY